MIAEVLRVGPVGSHAGSRIGAIFGEQNSMNVDSQMDQFCESQVTILCGAIWVTFRDPFGETYWELFRSPPEVLKLGVHLGVMFCARSVSFL